jgi:hypothetical protein
VSTTLGKSDMDKRIADVAEALEELCAAEPTYIASRAWFNGKYFKVYVRYGDRYINGRRVRALTIASIEVKERHWRKGIYKAFTAFAEDLAERHPKIEFVLRESVLNPVLIPFLLGQGYTLTDTAQTIDGVGGEYIKKIKETEPCCAEPES